MSYYCNVALAYRMHSYATALIVNAPKVIVNSKMLYNEIVIHSMVLVKSPIFTPNKKYYRYCDETIIFKKGW